MIGINSHGGFQPWGYPHSHLIWMVLLGKILYKRMMFWGVPLFEEPPIYFDGVSWFIMFRTDQTDQHAT